MMSLSASLTLIIAPRVHHDAIQSARKKTQSQALGLRIENEKFKIIGSSALNDVWFQGSLELWFSLFCQRKKEIHQEAGPVHRKSHLS